jgi:TPR repeat protein
LSVSSRTVVPIVFAAILGGVIALATARGRSGGAGATAEAPPPAAPEPQAAGEPRAEHQSTTSSLQPAPTAPEVASREPVAPAAPATSAAAPSASTEPAPTVAQAVSIVAPTSADALYPAEVDCDRKKLPEACERVALALETGTAGTRDAKRAEKLRRIALTLYVKQCESDRALSCTRLAEMYERGEIVQKNPKNGAALRARVVDLCRVKPNQIGCQSER